MVAIVSATTIILVPSPQVKPDRPILHTFDRLNCIMYHKQQGCRSNPNLKPKSQPRKYLIMHKSLAVVIATIAIGIPLSANADTYDDFIKTQLAQFKSVGSDRCKMQTREVMEEGNKIVYELCVLQGQPVFLRASNDGTPLSVSEYNRGKLVQLSLWEGTGGVGFRNGKPVVEWNSGEFGKRQVKWKLTAQEQSNYLAIAAKERRILLKFGIR
jgi:hypothetical protein